ncbi:hypothetical protein TNIN_244221 [Trichonephila inaurata madagascariensis]|uniref:Uncharacterized protein n=1 Tax=Trichonephila inaurata madagascariensis TaxID=2747483 RepID=A0A8X7CJL2_9ARAC|nr:hypothetical protein TNIN_244221 [Trichonephila inaurata madagascariensis]
MNQLYQNLGLLEGRNLLRCIGSCPCFSHCTKCSDALVLAAGPLGLGLGKGLITSIPSIATVSSQRTTINHVAPAAPIAAAPLAVVTAAPIALANNGLIANGLFANGLVSNGLLANGILGNGVIGGNGILSNGIAAAPLAIGTGLLGAPVGLGIGKLSLGLGTPNGLRLSKAIL